MTLTNDLTARRDAARQQLPPELLGRMDAATESLAASGLAGRALGVGDRVPDVVLPEARGASVSLSDRLAEGPVVLSFYRGGWCPYCNLELRALQGAHDRITAHGASLVAVSPETPDHSLSTTETAELAFEVLSDVGNVVARRFGLVFTVPEDLHDLYGPDRLDLPGRNGDDTYELPLPATYVIDTDGTVAWAFVDPDYTRRAEPDDVVEVLATLAAGRT